MGTNQDKFALPSSWSNPASKAVIVVADDHWHAIVSGRYRTSMSTGTKISAVRTSDKQRAQNVPVLSDLYGTVHVRPEIQTLVIAANVLSDFYDWDSLGNMFNE